MKPTPILFLGDSPDLTSGLARIGRDLATHVATLPEFRVGYLGLGGNGSVKLPFTQYVMQATPEHYEWGYYSLPKVWTDFSRGEPGIVFTIWDLTRLLWLSQPQYSPDEELRNFLNNRNFQLWGYIPIDSVGAGVPGPETFSGQILSGFDRLLAYTPWGRDVIRNFVPNHPDLDWMPHGLNLKTWRPYGNVDSDRLDDNPDQKGATQSGLDADICIANSGDPVRIGVVATNQSRKNWALMAEVACLLKLKYPNLSIWWHTDRPIKYWNLPALAEDFGISVDLTTSLTDQQLAERYRGCSVTLHPGMGEGFNYPAFESLACGTPVVHGDYAGCANLLRGIGLEEMLVTPDKFFLDGQFNCKWSLYNPCDWVKVIEHVLTIDRSSLPGKVSHLGWNNLWYPWKKWFTKGIR